MEISRKSPYPLVLSYSGLTPSTNYTVAIINDYSADLVEIPVTSDVSGGITTPLPDYFSRYDAAYAVEVYDMAGLELDDVVLTDNLAITRPYVDPSLLAETQDDLADAEQYEALARAIIDSITGGFKYKREIFETVGLGNDYLSSHLRLNKIIRVYENNLCVYDSESTDLDWNNNRDFRISSDRTAITIGVSGAYNRYQSRAHRIHNPVSDSFETSNDGGWSRHAVLSDANYSFFPAGWDYTVVVDSGYPVVPHDIQTATKMLYNDLKCNSLPYLNSYIKEYESGQFTLKFNDGAFSQTGNKIVDMILSNYPKTLSRIGVL